MEWYLIAIAAFLLIYVLFPKRAPGVGPAASSIQPSGIVSKKEFSAPDGKNLTSELRALLTYLKIPVKTSSIVTLSIDEDQLSSNPVFSGFHSFVEKLTQCCVVIIIHGLSKDAVGGEAALITRIDDAVQGKVPRHRILCHSSSIGKVAIVRQVRPHLHIEFDSDIRNQVSPHVPVLFLSSLSPPSSTPSSNSEVKWRSAPSLESLLKLQ